MAGTLVVVCGAFPLPVNSPTPPRAMVSAPKSQEPKPDVLVVVGVGVEPEVVVGVGVVPVTVESPLLGVLPPPVVVGPLPLPVFVPPV